MRAQFTSIPFEKYMNLGLSLTGRVLKPNWCLVTCCFPPIPLDGCFIRRCKHGCLQFVILKPILVALTFVFYAKGKYHDGNFSAKQSYLISLLYTQFHTLWPCMRWPCFMSLAGICSSHLTQFLNSSSSRVLSFSHIGSGFCFATRPSYLHQRRQAVEC